MAFRGHDERHESCQQGNFKELVNLLAKYDTTLKNYLEMCSKNTQYVSNHIKMILFSNYIMLCSNK